MIGDPLVLFHSLLDRPETFEPGVSELLQGLVSGKRSLDDLSSNESELLNRAAIDFATAKRPKPAPKPMAPRRLPSAARMAAKQEPEYEWRDHGRPVKVIDVPEGPATFWWRKKK